MRKITVCVAAIILASLQAASARNGGNETPKSILAYSFEACNFEGGCASGNTGWTDFQTNLTQQGYVVTRYCNDNYDDDPEGCTITNLISAGHSGVLGILYAHTNTVCSCIEVYQTAAARDAAYNAYIAAGWNPGGVAEIATRDAQYGTTWHYSIDLTDDGFERRLKPETTNWFTIVIMSGCCNSFGLFDDVGGRARFGNEGCPQPGTPNEWKFNVALLLERMSGFQSDGEKRPAGDAFNAGGFKPSFRMDPNGEEKTTLCPAVLSHEPTGTVVPGTVTGKVSFDTESAYWHAATDIIGVSANAVLNSAIWSIPKTQITFEVGDVDEGETITITVDEDDLLSHNNVTNLDGNQVPPNTDGTRPNEDDFKWAFTCSAPPPDPTGSSCPYLFVWDGSSFVEDNTILTASEDAALAEVVTDFYKLQKPLLARESEYHLQIREIEQEKSFIDHLELVVVDHPELLRIGVTPDGEIFSVKRSISPISAVDDKDADQLDKVREVDGDVYSRADPGSLTLTYSLPAEYSGSIAVGGKSAPDKDPNDRQPCHKTRRALAEKEESLKGMRIEVQDKRGVWIELPSAPARTTLVENFWLLDSPDLEIGEQFKVRIAWDREYTTDEFRCFFVSETLPEIRPLSLVSSYHSTNGSVTRLLQESDDQFVTLVNRETLDLCFPAQQEPVPEGMKRDFVLKSVGYYIADDQGQFSPSSDELVLFNSFPNPANPSTEIAYLLPFECDVRLVIYNVLGQKVRTLVDACQEAGYQSVRWDGKNENGEEVSSGVYLYTITVGSSSQTKKMLLLR